MSPNLNTNPMTPRKHDILSIQKPESGQTELLRLYNRRLERDRRFPGVDIDAIHWQRGAVRPGYKKGKP